MSRPSAADASVEVATRSIVGQMRSPITLFTSWPLRKNESPKLSVRVSWAYTRNCWGRGLSRPSSCVTCATFSGLNAAVPRSNRAAGSPGMTRNRKKLKTMTKARVSSACSTLLAM